jgi:hypothetical protein
MKKAFPVFAFAALLITFASCKKDYSCTCTLTSFATGKSSSSTVTLGRQRKSAAAADCRSRESNIIGAKTTCVLK